MSDAPMSRRARRTFEQEAAERAALADPTIAFAHGLVSGEIAAVDTDGAALSRRDRRRMERLAYPLEAWTAQEEMLVTGQIPTMTPERIAEQERISREKAESAAHEAAAASQEFRRLAQAEIWRSPESVDSPLVGVPAGEEAAEWPPAHDEPVAYEVLDEPAAYEAAEEPVIYESVAESIAYEPAGYEPAGYEPAPVEPAAPDFVAPEPVAPDFAMPEPAMPEPAMPEPARPEFSWAESQQPARDAQPVWDARAEDDDEDLEATEDYQPLMVLDDAPLAAVHPVHDASASAAEPESADPPVSERSTVFDALFPRGSSQVMLRQQDPFAEGASQVPEPGEQEHIPTLLPPTEVPQRALNAVDEMRRLAAEAMSGIERASKADQAAAAAAAAATGGPQSPEPSVVATFDSPPSVQSTSPVQQSPTPQSPEASAAHQQPAMGGELSAFAWGATEGHSPSADQASTEPTFDSIGGLAQREVSVPDRFAMPGQQASPPSGQFPIHAPQTYQAPQAPQALQAPQAPQGQTLQGPQGPAWASHPLNSPQGGATDPNDYTPVTNAPRPDFSGLYQPGAPSGFAPVTGAINTGGFAAGGYNITGFTSTDPSATGQVPAVRRPDLPEVGGAKHFKWVHLAVIGALMFVLGVVIYNAAFAK